MNFRECPKGEVRRIPIPRTSVNKRLSAGYLILTTMTRRGWIVAALGIVLLVAVAIGIFLFSWDWKALIGWRALVDYIDPKNSTDRKDAIQVYALIVAGVVATITAAVGLANLWLTRRNLVQQRELEEQRGKQQRELEAQRAEQQRELAQGTALQAYYEQIGNLITEFDLRNTQREEIRELARGQTLTVLQEVDGNGKGSLLTFLQGAGLIETQLKEPEETEETEETKNPAVALYGADFQGAILHPGTDLYRANLEGANLQGATLVDADLGGRAGGANLQNANLQGANLSGANLQNANLRDAKVTYEQLDAARSLRGATMPNGTKYR
jgi:hypothetical protein